MKKLYGFLPPSTKRGISPLENKSPSSCAKMRKREQITFLSGNPQKLPRHPGDSGGIKFEDF